MDARERKKQQASSVSQLHTIDVAKAMANAKDAAKKMNPRRPEAARQSSEDLTDVDLDREDLTLPVANRTLPIIIAVAVVVAATTYFLVSRFFK